MNEETIARFRIGYAPDSGFLLRDRLANEFSEEVLRESGLFSWKQEDNRQERSENREGAPSLSVRSLDGQGGDFDSAPTSEAQALSPKPKARMYSKFRNRVMFPIANDAGRIIAFTGRTLSTDEKAGPKYLNSPETPLFHKGGLLYNHHNARQAAHEKLSLIHI